MQVSAWSTATKPPNLRDISWSRVGAFCLIKLYCNLVSQRRAGDACISSKKYQAPREYMIHADHVKQIHLSYNHRQTL